MRRMGITQADIDAARKSEESRILNDAKQKRANGTNLDQKDKEGATMVSNSTNHYAFFQRFVSSYTYDTWAEMFKW